MSKQATSPQNSEHLNTTLPMNTELTEYHFCIIPSFDIIMFSKPHWCFATKRCGDCAGRGFELGGIRHLGPGYNVRVPSKAILAARVCMHCARQLGDIDMYTVQ